ncbi:MAG: hypothetical protein CVV33_02500 [Methanomicrobiales archaeon HGW-Methanomicrobiales-4]|nr:MAG: hypothetical protein CVV33_02500 [Methanomicrobiales archaeon HGW-Methanomicrobiales-4]
MDPIGNQSSGTALHMKIRQPALRGKTGIPLIEMIVFLALISGYGVADRLPSEVPENQQFAIDTEIEATGLIDDTTTLDWTLVKNGTTTDTALGKSEIIAVVRYSDTLLSNGGNISEIKNTGFDSSSMSSKKFNLESEKVLTYASTEGSHLTGSEYLLVNIAGNYSSDKSNETMCVMESPVVTAVPAFCNVVSVQSDLININSAQVSTKSQLRAAGSSSTSSGIGYQIAVTPDTASGDQYAEGIVKTEFSGSITEARVGKQSSSSKKKSTSSSSQDWKTPAATNVWKDTTEVIGGISNLQKVFEYQSGMKL